MDSPHRILAIYWQASNALNGGDRAGLRTYVRGYDGRLELS